MNKGLESRASESDIYLAFFQFHFTHGPPFFFYHLFGHLPPLRFPCTFICSLLNDFFSLVLLYLSSYFLTIDLAFKELKARR